MNRFFKPQFLTALVLTIFFSSCVTAANISEELTPAELIQRAQEAMDRNSYNTAIQYYQALHERSRNNIDFIITAEYHIANIHYKQRKYDIAREELNSMLEYYNTPDQELLPQHFKRLAQIVLQHIEERESRRSPAAR